MEKFAPHTTLQTEIGKRGNVLRRERAVRATGIAKKTGVTLETQGVLNTSRRRVTFILNYFPASGEGE
jgi:hypothetical protein